MVLRSNTAQKKTSIDPEKISGKPFQFYEQVVMSSVRFLESGREDFSHTVCYVFKTNATVLMLGFTRAEPENAPNQCLQG